MKPARTAIAAAVAVALGTAAATVPVTASASLVTADWSGLFTLLNGSGDPVMNSSYPYYDDPTWGYGLRTQVSGTLSVDTDSGSGSATINAFDFFSEYIGFSAFDLQAIGDGMGGPGTLVLGNLSFDWSANGSTPVSVVLDAAGFMGALASGQTTGSVSGTGALPASDGMRSGQYPIGPAPLATTSWNTNSLCTPVNSGDCLNVHPISSAITIDDGVGGSPMVDGPFVGYNMNFDITLISNLDVSTQVPVPAAIWLFGTGLLGLAGIARRKQAG